ncbi:hypothetical protein GAY29_01100 [Azospirillum brasilense]|nr:hypothetical protein [Azospirillum brasilense]
MPQWALHQALAWAGGYPHSDGVETRAERIGSKHQEGQPWITVPESTSRRNRAACAWFNRLVFVIRHLPVPLGAWLRCPPSQGESVRTLSP